MGDTKIIVITGASSGFGDLAARALARAGHAVYAGMRATAGRNASQVAELAELSAAEGIDVRGIEMDVQDQASVDAAIAQIVAEQGRLDVVVHNAGHMVLGPTEAFTPEQLAEVYDINVLSTQSFRVHIPAVPTTSPTPAHRPTKNGPMNTPPITGSCATAWRRALLTSSPTATMPERSPTRSRG